MDLPGSSSLRHMLPQIPTRGQHSRGALTKSFPDAGSITDPEIRLVSMEELDARPDYPLPSADPPPAPKVAEQIPTPPASETASQCSPQGSALSSNSGSPPTPIKLRIRRSVCDGKTEVCAEEVTPDNPSAPPAPQAESSKPPTPKRARTKGELKKQLQEKRGKRSGLLPVLPPPPEPEPPNVSAAHRTCLAFHILCTTSLLPFVF